MWGDLKGQRIEDVARALREAAFLRRNPPPAIVRMTEAHGTRAELVA